MALPEFTGLNYAPSYTGYDGEGKSSIDYKSNADQMNTFYWLRKSLTDARKEMTLTCLSIIFLLICLFDYPSL